MRFITSESQTGDPYAALSRLDDALECDQIKTASYIRTVVEFITTPHLKVKDNKFARSTGTNKLFLLLEESFVSAEVCGNLLDKG